MGSVFLNTDFLFSVWVSCGSGQVEEGEVVDSKILQYCSIDKKEKKSVGELEQEFLQALQVGHLSF